MTGLLQAWSRGEAEALELLAPLVHRELRGIAKRMLSDERRADGWQPTDLVHESYVRLLDWRVVRWQNRAHFFATTATMMRRVLVDAARARHRVKRGGDVPASSLDGVDIAAPEPLLDILALEDALTALAAVDPRPSRVIELRFFGGVQRRRDGGGARRVGPHRDQRLEHGARVAPQRARRARLRMTAERWQLLSEWHNTWLAAGADERDRLRQQFAELHPGLAAEADALASASAGLPGFLETRRSRSPPAISRRTTRHCASAPWRDRITSSNCWRAGGWAMSIAPPTRACNGTWP